MNDSLPANIEVTSVQHESPDWSREQKAFWTWQPSRSLLCSIRAYQCHSQSNSYPASILKKIAILRHCFWSIVTGADIPLNSNIGGGLLLPHPNGIVIHPDAKIGVNCLIFQQVTIGTAGTHDAPVIGNHVDIGAGAKLLGAINIGNNAKIGANAVVLEDVPPSRTAVGVPARVI